METKHFREELLCMTRVIQGLISASFAPVCREHDLSIQQMRILMSLLHEPGQTVGELSDSTQVLRNNITGVCKKLEQRDLLRRIRSEKDERVVMVWLTRQGEDLMEQIEDEIEIRYGEVFDQEPEETYQTIDAGMKKLCELLEKMQDTD